MTTFFFFFARTQTEGEPETQGSQVTYWKVEVQVFQLILGEMKELG